MERHFREKEREKSKGNQITKPSGKLSWVSLSQPSVDWREGEESRESLLWFTLRLASVSTSNPILLGENKKFYAIINSFLYGISCKALNSPFLYSIIRIHQDNDQGCDNLYRPFQEKNSFCSGCCNGLKKTREYTVWIRRLTGTKLTNLGCDI